MVGIKGRSKACRTCLRRKKGCGQQRPSCEQCLKAQIPCGGYATELIFIDHSANGRCSLSAPKASSGTSTSNSGRPRPQVSAQRGSTRPSPSPGAPNSGATHNLAAGTTLSKAAYEAKICGLFWDMFLPNGRTLPLDMTRDKMGGWISAVQDLHNTHPVLRKTMLALSLTTVGKSNGDAAMMQDGITYYGEALVEASAALRTQKKDNVHALLAAIRLFTVYELLHGLYKNEPLAKTEEISWSAHILGEMAYVAAQKPSDFAEHHLHQLFVEGRIYMGSIACRNRARCFLTKDAWMTEPWAIHKKTPRDLLLDIFLLLPGIFEDLDMCGMYPPETQKRIRAHLVARCSDMLDRLLAWHDLYSATPHLATCEEEIPKTIKAHDLAVAYLISMYWSTSLICVSLYDNLVASLVDTPQYDSLPRSSARRAAAFIPDEICRNLINVMPICLHPASGVFRATIIGLQLGIANMYLSTIPTDRMTKERRWLAENIRKPECAAISGFIWNLHCVGAEKYGPMLSCPGKNPSPRELLEKGCERDLGMALASMVLEGLPPAPYHTDVKREDVERPAAYC